jgi:hypothetical protein
MGAPGQQSGAMSAAQAMQQNLQLRQMLLGSAPAQRKALGNFAGQLGGSTRIKIFNVGVTTRILLDVTMTYDVATAAVTPTIKAPFNVMNRVKLTDFDGTDRINASGYQLFVLNSVRRRMQYGYNNGSAAAVLTAPTAGAGTVGVGRTLNFQMEIPLAFDPTADLRGALLTQTAVGEAWVNIDWNTVAVSASDVDSIFNSATGVVSNVAFSVAAFQEYLLPQSINGQVPLPTFDLMTVYEFAGALKSTDNLAVGSEKLLNYPNVRSVIGSYFNYVNGGVLNAAPTDIQKLRLIANGNNVLKEYGPRDKLFEQRIYMLDGSDLRPGTYFEPHRQKPIETALFGNIQYGITPNTVSAGNTYVEVAFESFYTKGAALPGLSQASG